VVPRKSWISLTLASPLDSKTAKVQDPLSVTLNETLTLEGKPVLPAGTALKAHVTRVRRPESSCTPGYVFWALDDFPVPSYSVEVFGVLSPKDRSNTPPAIVALDPSAPAQQARKGGIGQILIKPVEVAVGVSVVVVALAAAIGQEQHQYQHCSGKGHEMVLPAGTKFLVSVSEKLPPSPSMSDSRITVPRSPDDPIARSPDPYGVPYNCR
jgi:hypothetical protein